MPTPTKVCIFNPVSLLIDVTNGVDGVVVPATGAAQAGAPVVLNPSGVIDSTLLGQGTTATAGENLLGDLPLVNLYTVAGVLYMQKAFAGAVGTAPSGDAYPVSAQGFITDDIAATGTGTVSFTGIFVYNDPNNEFSAGDIGSEVYLSSILPGGVTLTRPSGFGELDQSVGYMVAFTAPHLVTVQFLAGFNDFSRISGIAVIGQGGTSATTGAQALLNLIAGSPSTGNALIFNGSNWVPGTASTPFTNISSGTNTTATMTVGTGASIVVSGTGVVQATKLSTTGAAVVISGAAPPSTGQTLTATSATTAAWSTPTGAPGAPSTSVQFNNTGSFAGDANFTWDFPNAFNPPSPAPTPALILGPAGTNEGSYQSRLIVNDRFTTTAPVSFANETVSLDLEMTGDQSALSFANIGTTLVTRNTAHYGTIYCADINFSHQGTGLLDYVNGVYSTLSTNPGSDVTTMVSIWGTCGAQGNAGALVAGVFIPQFYGPTCFTMAGVSIAVSNATGAVTDCYGIKIDNLGNAGTITNSYGVYVGNPKVGTVTNAWGIFVAGGVSQFTGVATSIVTKTANYTATADDATLIGNAVGGTFTITLPTTGIAVGQTYRIKKIDASANLLTIASAGNIDGLPSISLTTQYQSVDVQWNGSTWWVF